MWELPAVRFDISGHYAHADLGPTCHTLHLLKARNLFFWLTCFFGPSQVKRRRCMQEVCSSQMPTQRKRHCYEVNSLMLGKLEKHLPASSSHTWRCLSPSATYCQLKSALPIRHGQEPCCMSDTSSASLESKSFPANPPVTCSVLASVH